MSFLKPDAPPAPDYAAAAVAQGAQNRETALVNNANNRVNQYTPWGNQTWSMRPGADPNNPQVGDYTQTVNLSPSQQAMFDGNNRINQQMLGISEGQLNRVGSTFGAAPDTSNLPGWYTSSGRVPQAANGQRSATSGPPAPMAMVPAAAPAPQAGDWGGVQNTPPAGGAAPAGSGAPTINARNQFGQLVTNAMRVGGGTAARQQGFNGVQQPTSYGMNGLGAPGGGPSDMAWGGVQNTPGQGGGGGGGGGGGPYSATPGNGGTGPTGSYSGRFGAGAVPGVVNDASRQRVEQALLSRLEPQYQQDEARLRNQLLAQGLEVGTPAYAAELDRLSRAQNDARMQAVLAGGQEESRQTGLNANLQQQAFTQGLQGSQFDNQTRQQMLAEMLTMRNLPINELNALRTGTQVSAPQFGSYYTNNAQAAPVFEGAQAQGNYNMQAYQQQMQGYNGLMGGLSSLGAAGIGLL